MSHKIVLPRLREMKWAALFLIALNLQAKGQEIQYGWLVPDFQKHPTKKKDIAYLPEEGLNVYDKPGGEVIARLGRDPRSKNYPNYLLNIFLRPRNRAPELLQSTALAPLPDNCFAIPFIKTKGSFYFIVRYPRSIPILGRCA